MKRKLIFLVILIGIVFSIFLLLQWFTGRTPKQGVLKVNASPEANIFLDNQNTGKTPMEEKVSEGEYTIKLVPDSTSETLASWQGKINVAHNLLTYVNASLGPTEFSTAIDILWLEKISGNNSEIAVTTSPDGATVTIDGEIKGTTPVTIADVSVGDHTISVASPGFATRSIKVKTTAGYRLNTSMKLALTGEQLPSPSLEASPSAEITGTISPTGLVTPSVTPTRGATSSATLNDPPRPFIEILETPTDFLRVRATPQGEEVGRVDPGQKFTLLDEQNGWFKIAYDGENEGWVSSQYAVKTE